MKRVVKENQIVLAGRVGNIEKKNEGLTIVSLSNRISKDDTEWTNVAFLNAKEGGPQFADLANKFIEKGQYIVVVTNKTTKGEYENFYAQAVDFGPKPIKKEQE